MVFMTQILQEAEITNGFVYLKFNSTIQLATITTASYVVETDEATPVEVVDPFNEFTVANNYNTVSRALKIYWATGALEPSTSYTLTVSGLKDAASRDIEEFSLSFTTEASVDPDESEIEPPTLDVIEIEDYSIISDIDFTQSTELSDAEVLTVETSDPLDGAFFLDNDHNNGRVTITFSHRPSVEKISSTYFKAYRKKIQRQPIKWESLDARISLDSLEPEVNIDFPSLDDTPVYFTADSDYFEDGYKYKITVSKGLST
jgi:hypothetical protein